MYDRINSLYEGVGMRGSSNAPKIVHSNKNLLDNWDFTNPVNQRGQSSYSSIGYGIDRWRNVYNGAAMQIVNGGVKVASNGVKYTGMLQIVPIKNVKAGDSYTLSGLFKSITDGWYVELYLYDNNEIVAGVTSADKNYNGSDVLVSSTLIIPNRTFGENLQMHVHIYNQTTNQNSCIISAAKLELGEVSTLKNDALGVSYAEELRKCQRYLVNVGKFRVAGNLKATNGFAVHPIWFPCEMREKPAIYKSETLASENVSAEVFDVQSKNSATLYIKNNAAYDVHYDCGILYAMFSAEL